MPKVLLVTKAQIELAEKALNGKLGRYFKANNITYVSGSEDIDTVDIDESQFMQESGSGDYIINADKIKQLYLTLTGDDTGSIDSRFGTKLDSWIDANAVDFSTITVSGSDLI